MLKTRTLWLWLIPILLTAVWIGARGLNADALWFDEYWSVYNAGGAQYGPLSPGEIWGRVAEQDPWQAPGYFVLLAGWGAAVGWTPFALRALSMLAGALAVAWAYRMGRDLISPIGGLGAAVTMGLSAYFLYYFHEMRTYTLVVLLIAMTGWGYWRVINGGRWWTGAALVLGAVGLLYTHYFGALTIGILGIYHLLFVKKDGRWLRVTLLMVAAGVLFLPWLGVLFSGLNSASEDTLRQASAWTPRQAIEGVLFMFSNGGVILTLVLGGYALFTQVPSSNHGEAEQYTLTRRFSYWLIAHRMVVFASVWLVGMATVLLLINARFGVILEVRYLFPLWPPLALVMGLAIHRLAHSGARTAALLIVCAWVAAGVWNSVDSESANTLSNPHWHQPWNVLVDSLRPRVLEDDAVVYLLPDWTWPSYHDKVFDYYLDSLPMRLKGTLLQRPENVGEAVFEEQERDAFSGATRVWLAQTTDQPTSYVDSARHVLEDAGYLECAVYDQPPMLGLDLYMHEATGYELASFGGDDSAGWVTLNLFTGGYRAADHTLSLTAFWSPGSDVPADTYSVGLHVENAQGQLVTQADYGLPREAHSCRTVDVSLKDVPTGTYTVYVLVYNWQTGERLNTTDGEAVDRLEVRRYNIP